MRSKYVNAGMLAIAMAPFLVAVGLSFAVGFPIPPAQSAGVYQNPGGAASSVSVSGNVTTVPTGTSAANMTSSTVTLTGSDQTVTLTAASQSVVIVNQSTSAKIYINFNGAATSSNGAIMPGGSFNYIGGAVSSVHVLGTGAELISVFAN